MGIKSRLKNLFFVKYRIWKYKILSSCKNITGNPKILHPLLINGKGMISFGENVQIGVVNSQNFYSHYSYLEARTFESIISIGSNTSINNAFSAVAFLGIQIGKNVLIGCNCSIIDNDGHRTEIEKRHNQEPISVEVFIGNNVFIGNDVTVLKGVSIGENSIIGNGSIVTKSIPSNVIAAGNPAKIIRNL